MYVGLHTILYLNASVYEFANLIIILKGQEDLYCCIHHKNYACTYQRLHRKKTYY